MSFESPEIENLLKSNPASSPFFPPGENSDPKSGFRARIEVQTTSSEALEGIYVFQ